MPPALRRVAASADVTITARAVRAQRPVPTSIDRPAAGRYDLSLAASEADVRAAQRLRHRIFALEQGAITPGAPGLDSDQFDDVCDHVLVTFSPSASIAGSAAGPDGGSTEREVVATYRLLPPHGNDSLPRAAGLYSHTEFGLMPLEGLLDEAVEAGRACVHPDHRRGAAMSLLWRGIARYMDATGYRYLVGCASIGLSDGGANAAAFWDLARERHLAPAWRRCRPRFPLPIGHLPRADRPELPPLIRGYLRLGAVVCGPPAWDTDFGAADFLLLLDLERTDRRYLRHFLGSPALDPLVVSLGSAGGG